MLKSLLTLTRIAVALTVSGLGACDFVETEHFLSEPSDSAIDSRILGTWIATNATADQASADVVERALIVTVDAIVNAAGDNLLDIALIGVSRNKGAQPAFFWMLTQGHTTAIGDRTFLNLGPITSFELDPNANLADAMGSNDAEYARQIAEYRIDDADRLHIGLMEADFVASAVRDNAITGEIEEEKYSTHVKLTESPDALIKFISEAPAEALFKSVGSYFIRGTKAPESD